MEIGKKLKKEIVNEVSELGSYDTPIPESLKHLLKDESFNKWMKSVLTECSERTMEMVEEEYEDEEAIRLILNPVYGDMSVQIEELDANDIIGSFMKTETAYDILGEDYFDEDTGEPIMENIPFKNQNQLENYINRETDYRVEWD